MLINNLRPIARKVNIFKANFSFFTKSLSVAGVKFIGLYGTVINFYCHLGLFLLRRKRFVE